MFESLRNLCICIPDHHNIIDTNYLSNITKIITDALTNYHLDLDKFKEVFSRYNYYDNINNIPVPVYYSVQSFINKYPN